MTDPDATETPIDSFTDLPIQPTGSGVADLEIAYEQMKLAEDAADKEAVATSSTTARDIAESAAHPS